MFVGPETAWAIPSLLRLGLGPSASASDPKPFLLHFLPFSPTTAVSAFPPLHKSLGLGPLVLSGSFRWDFICGLSHPGVDTCVGYSLWPGSP